MKKLLTIASILMLTTQCNAMHSNITQQIQEPPYRLEQFPRLTEDQVKENLTIIHLSPDNVINDILTDNLNNEKNFFTNNLNQIEKNKDKNEFAIFMTLTKLARQSAEIELRNIKQKYNSIPKLMIEETINQINPISLKDYIEIYSRHWGQSPSWEQPDILEPSEERFNKTVKHYYNLKDMSLSFLLLSEHHQLNNTIKEIHTYNQKLHQAEKNC